MKEGNGIVNLYVTKGPSGSGKTTHLTNVLNLLTGSVDLVVGLDDCEVLPVVGEKIFFNGVDSGRDLKVASLNQLWELVPEDTTVSRLFVDNAPISLLINLICGYKPPEGLDSIHLALNSNDPLFANGRAGVLTKSDRDCLRLWKHGMVVMNSLEMVEQLYPPTKG